MLVTATADHGALSYQRRMLVLAICCMSLFVVGVDVTAVNVALPSVQRGLRAGLGELQWMIDAYTLTLASLLMLSGSTADRLGRRRTFQLGLVIFAAASLGCGVAPTISWLIVFRAVQGIGGSMLNPVAMSIIRAVFTQDRERARALGIWAGVFGVAMAVGPLVGGLMLGVGWGWRAIFWINVPLAVAALALTARFVPEFRVVQPRRIDPVGQALVIVALAAATWGIIEGPRRGWESSLVLGCFAAATAAAVGVVIYEPRRRDPLLDPRFFRHGPLSAAAIICCLGFAAFGGLLWVNTLYLQNVRGYSALQAGLIFTPMAAMTVLFGPVSGRLVARHGPRSSLLICGACMATGALMLTELTPSTPLGWLLGAYTVFGVGFAMISAPTNNAALTAMPASQAGTAAGITSTSRQIGQVFGVAIAGSVLTCGLHHPRSSFTAASRPVWWIIAGYGAGIILLGFIVARSWAARTGARTDVHRRHARLWLHSRGHRWHSALPATPFDVSFRALVRSSKQRRGRHRAGRSGTD